MFEVNGNVLASGKAAFGVNNDYSGTGVFVAGGYNTASADGSAVGGGAENGARNVYAVVAGGHGNEASGYCSAVGGGRYNKARGDYSIVCGGGGQVSVDTNVALGNWATVGGGGQNLASGVASVIAGGVGCTASQYGTVIGGGASNTASAINATVGGGRYNRAGGGYSVVAGGGGSSAADSNQALGSHSAIGGGSGNQTHGSYSTVPGGRANHADSAYAFAAGRRAKAQHDGAFVWADHTDADFTSTASDQFLIRASGGVGIGTNSPQTALHVASGDIRCSDSDTQYVELAQTTSGGGFLTAMSSEEAKKWLRIQNLYQSGGSSGGQCEFRFEIGDESSPLTAMTIEENGDVGIGTPDPATKFAVVGLTGTSSYNNVRVNTANGAFYYETSTQRNKENIQPLDSDFDRIFQAEPKVYIDKASGQREIGYIAEEFDALGLTDLVIYDADGQPNGLKYERISLYLLEVMKERSDSFTRLETQVAAMQAQLQALLAAQQ
jgi:hypothetical protein